VRKAGWEVARLDELESLPGPGTLRWTPVRRPFGITAFGVNAYTASEVGQDVVEEHTERTLGHEELYVVLTGRATFRLDEEEHDAPAGTVVFIRDPSVRRGAKAAEPGTTVLAVGGKPGSHEVSDWEYSFAAYGYLKEGDADRGLAVLHEGLEAKGESARLSYDLACFESLAGKHEEAIEHLLRAVELDPQYREYARDDEDLDAIRDDPRFPGSTR
jgi:mannose-6-phosphate isomerase-like protein (cupin superfamily)